MKCDNHRCLSCSIFKKYENIEGELDLIEYPHQIIIWNKKLCKENLELKSKSFKELKKVFLREKMLLLVKMLYLTQKKVMLFLMMDAKFYLSAT